MNNRKKQILTLMNLAKDKEQKALVGFANEIQSLQCESLRLNDLKQFHLEYLKKLHQYGTDGLSIHAVKNYHEFIHQLELAIIKQQELVNSRQKRVENARSTHAKASQHTSAMSKLHAKVQTAINVQLDRQEQKVLDELSQGKRYEQNSRSADD